MISRITPSSVAGSKNRSRINVQALGCQCGNQKTQLVCGRGVLDEPVDLAGDNVQKLVGLPDVFLGGQLLKILLCSEGIQIFLGHHAIETFLERAEEVLQVFLGEFFCHSYVVSIV